MQISQSSKLIITQGRERPTYFISKNKKVQIWYRKFGHTSNVRIIKNSQLLNEIGNFNVKYDSTKVYSNSKDFYLKYKNESILPTPNILLSTVVLNTLISNTSIQTVGKLSTSSARTTMDQDFNSLYFIYVTLKQTCIII